MAQPLITPARIALSGMVPPLLFADVFDDQKNREKLIAAMRDAASYDDLPTDIKDLLNQAKQEIGIKN